MQEGWTFFWQIVYKQKMGRMDLMGSSGKKCQVDDWRNQTMYKNSNSSGQVNPWKGISKHEAVATASNTPEAAHLVKPPRPSQANMRKEARDPEM